MKKATIYYSDTLTVKNIYPLISLRSEEKEGTISNYFIMDCDSMTKGQIKKEILDIQKAIKYDNDVVIINNVPKKFDYTNILYSVSDGVKNENSESPLFPKFIITTKFLPKFDASSKRRCDVFELKKID
jgi:hypothetical protein